jgi:hypothetical protein
MSADPTDDLIQALCTARERGLTLVESQEILRDVFDAPWSAATVSRFGDGKPRTVRLVREPTQQRTVKVPFRRVTS